MPLSFSHYRTRTLGIWAGATALVVVYFTDWQVVMGKMPYVKGRFEKKD